MDTKACSACKEVKSRDEFYVDVRAADGFTSQCKSCRRLATAKTRAKNPDKARAKSLAYFNANREKMREHAKEFFRANPDRVRKYQETAKPRQKAWRDANKERSRANNQASAFLRRFEKHGLTLDQYHAIAERQDFLCAVCHEQPVPYHSRSSPDGFVIDHHHVTGKVRGLVCSNCNVGLGMLKDSADVAASASRYLSLHAA